MFEYATSLNDLKKNKWIHKHILWDIEPKQIMEPRRRITKEGIFRDESHQQKD